MAQQAGCRPCLPLGKAAFCLAPPKDMKLPRRTPQSDIINTLQQEKKRPNDFSFQSPAAQVHNERAAAGSEQAGTGGHSR